MSGFTAIVAVLALVGAVLAGLYALSRLVRVDGTRRVAAPFTGGLAPEEHALSRYHARWFPVTLLFLAFDMEMVFMYPWTLVISTMGASAVIEMFAFLAVLLAGVGYAWREGALRWT